MDGLKTLRDASNMLGKQAAKIENSTVSEYIRQQAEFITSKGGNLEDYYLVREQGNMTYDDGHTIKQGMYYGLKHKDSVKMVEFPVEYLGENVDG